MSARIKPLEWREYREDCWLADSVGDTYTVRTGLGEDDEDEDRWYLSGRNEVSYDSPDEPKRIAERLHLDSIREFLLESTIDPRLETTLRVGDHVRVRESVFVDPDNVGSWVHDWRRWSGFILALTVDRSRGELRLTADVSDDDDLWCKYRSEGFDVSWLEVIE